MRFAPSPTGTLHLGGLRTALFNFLFARRHGGAFILRIEDTDQSRLVPGALQNIVDTLAWAGLSWDEGPVVSGDVVADRGPDGPYLQSKRLALYREHADKLVATGAAYPCFCTPERLEEMRTEQALAKRPPSYDGTCRELGAAEVGERRARKLPEVIRLKVPREGTTAFTDLVHGTVTFQNTLVDDQVLLKSDGFPTYHLAVVVDDHHMRISHVIRGDEWLPSTPKHLLLYAAFGWEAPEFAHLPLLLKPGGGKLSKRDLASSVFDLVGRGYLREALLNFIALLGWHPPGEEEVLSLEEMTRQFDFKNVNRAGAVFTTDKLDWLNGIYLRRLPAEEFAERCRPFLERAGLIRAGFPSEDLVKMVPLEQERVRTLDQVPEAVAFMFNRPAPEPSVLVWKAQKPEEAAERLTALLELITSLPEASWTVPELERRIKERIAEEGTPVGETLWPMRVALSGRTASPGPFELAQALGAKETLARIRLAIETLRA